MAVQEMPRETVPALDDHEHCPCIEQLRAALEHFRGLALANGVTLGEIADRIDRDKQG